MISKGRVFWLTPDSLRIHSNELLGVSFGAYKDGTIDMEVLSSDDKNIIDLSKEEAMKIRDWFNLNYPIKGE